MDLVTHLLAGILIVVGVVAFGHDITPAETSLIIFGSILPDLVNFAMYPMLAKELRKPISKLTREDWSGYGFLMPKLYQTYMVLHSLVPVAICFGLEVWVLGFPALSLGWLGHVLYDFPTHAGEFRTAPLYPISSWAKLGWTDAWVWPFKWMATSWIVHAAAIGMMIAAQYIWI